MIKSAYMYSNYDKKSKFTEEEKENIFKQLNEQRLLRQKNEERHKNRLKNKKVYNINNKRYYRIDDLNRSYYIAEDELQHISYRPKVISLFTYSYTIMQETKGLIRIDWATDRLLVSDDIMRIYFKPFRLKIDYSPTQQVS